MRLPQAAVRLPLSVERFCVCWFAHKHTAHSKENTTPARFHMQVRCFAPTMTRGRSGRCRRRSRRLRRLRRRLRRCVAAVVSPPPCARTDMSGRRRRRPLDRCSPTAGGVGNIRFGYFATNFSPEISCLNTKHARRPSHPLLGCGGWRACFAFRRSGVRRSANYHYLPKSWARSWERVHSLYTLELPAWGRLSVCG